MFNISRVRVVVEASDPLTAAGLADHLRFSPELQILPQSELSVADVLVMCVDIVDPATLIKLRDAAASRRLRTILVTDHMAEEHISAAAACRVVTVLGRHEVTPQRLPDEVVHAYRDRATNAESSPGSERARASLDARLRDLLAQNGARSEAIFDSRELDVLRLLAEGHGTSEIAERIAYSERTVKNLLYAILTRLQARNRSHAVACALRAGLI
ncbi:MAG: hypothetical protein JWN95_2268 [Frankiales bacterium]|nr:hypothetical protein [Frankiales bacterium]